MVSFSLSEAAERTGTSKVDIWRAIKEGSLAAKKTADGGFAIEAAELFRVFEPQPRPPEPPPHQENRLPDFGQPETAPPEPEPAPANEIAVAFAALEAEMRGLLLTNGSDSAKA